MRQWQRLRELCRTLFGGARVDRELDEELHDWVETLADRHRARGLPDEAARRLAVVELGGVQQLKEEARSMRNGSQVESTSVDVRYAWRALRRTPGFTAAAIVTFALGIGATTAIFSVVKAVLLDPLPYRQADRLLFVWADLTDLGYPHAPLAGPELVEFQENVQAFDQMGGIWATNGTLAGVGDPEQLRVATVTPDFFSTLGVEAAHGRVIGPDDFGQSVTPVLLSHALWTRSFGGDPAAVGRSITWNDRPATVVGVMGEDFELLFPPDAAVPPDLQAWIPGGARLAAQPRGQQYLRVVGRLAPGATAAEAIEQVAAVGRAMQDAHPGNYSPGSRFFAVPMQEDNVRPVRAPLVAVFGGVSILLMIAGVNIAGLLIVRAAARRRETTVRTALGATRGRLFRQFLVEGFLLAGLGGVAGVGAAYLTLRALVGLAPATLGRVHAADLDPGVLLFAAVAALVWGVCFSLLPWIDARRLNLRSALDGGGRTTGGVLGTRARAGLVVLQVALGLTLLVGAALLARTFDRLLRLDPGFNPNGLLTFRVAPPFSRYASLDAHNAFHRRVIEALGALPGVAGVGSVSHLPYDNLPNWGTPYLPMGEADGAKAGLTDTRAVAPGFFEAVDAELLAGRFFTEHDSAATAMPVVIDDIFARILFGHEDPLRRQFQVDLGGSGRMSPMEVIGVVRHLRHRSLTDHGREQLFVSSRLWFRTPTSYVVRTTGDPQALAAPAREAIRALDPLLPVYDVRPMDSYVALARGPNRFTMLLSISFAGVALVLACVGVYGVLAYSVSRRTREFGIRLALGAERGRIVRLVLGEGVRLSAAGLVLGAGGAIAGSRLLQSQLFGVSPYDPIAYAAAFGLLGLAALAASVVPALRASRLAPMGVLRDDR